MGSSERRAGCERAGFGEDQARDAASITRVSGWVWRQLSKIFGPATISGDALQGCTQEARDQWKRHLEARRKAG
ncbi:hypothetical protein [Catenuloplanes atrovinosus]|uniref:Uncharacterized protein n=1 Tax=Catenuloplanes atrovinosus TaxID=137266 RepID=A0AAE3YLF5_9ACTN|nr:hypothetical protein [Catenuloplanes atrovinosus]MDR7274600.1 hypothetical protein [Catenuloplanes atrovinosus]